eukprot:509678_1
MDTVLNISQIKSFLHYTYDKDLQHQDIDTSRDIPEDDDTKELQTQTITLPSLNRTKTKNMGKILIQSKYLWSESKMIQRWHVRRTATATKPVVAGNIIAQEPNMKEVQRQQKARIEMYTKQNLLQGKDIMVDNDTKEEQKQEVKQNDTSIDDVNNMMVDIDVNKNVKHKHKKSSKNSNKKRTFSIAHFCKHCGKGFKYKGSMKSHEKGCVGPLNR